MKLMIAMPAAWIPDDASGEQGARRLPVLPALTRLLHRARPAPGAADWRRGVLQALGAQDIAPVAVAARAVPRLAADVAVCFADPLHVVAGMSRVHLPPGGRLQLDAWEALQWQQAFNAQFAADGILLHQAGTGGDWLLEAPCAHAARDAEPSGLVGAALERRAAGTSDEKALRRLGAEVEMWLASHALNRLREARREPVLNALWFWGGGHASSVPPLSWQGRLASNARVDAWTAGLSRLVDQPVERVQALHGCTLQGEEELLILLTPETEGAFVQSWQHLEQQWFEPVMRALQARELRSLRLQVGSRAWEAPDRSLLRWLRRPRGAWWQILDGEQS